MTTRLFSKSLLALFDRVMDLPENEHQAFIDSNEVPPEFKADLSRLLKASRESSLFPDRPDHLISEIFQESPSIQSGQRIGAYRLEKLLGEGGMASVWLARREDDRIAHQVAIKCLKTGLNTPLVRNYFLREQQILAQLRHPNIATMHDAGVTPDGVPYIIMEWVEDGLTLIQYCDQHRLNVPQRLALFQKACAAVHYAHQNLIVHRDLKPSNILVNCQGELKLLDFGIAKLLDGNTAEHTRTGLKPLTPDYAAPEQFNLGNITTATDTFALGLILYELLCGIKAQTWDEKLRRSATTTTAPGEALRRLGKSGERQTLEAILADRSSSLDQLDRALQGDLGTIVACAMQEDPQRRYASVADLGDDLSRCQHHHPIKARKDNWHYRGRKFLRRHYYAILLASVATGSLLAATAISLRQADLARTEAQRATTEARRSEATKRFLTRLLEVSDSGIPRDALPTTEELLQDGAKRVRQEFGQVPELEMELSLLLGRVYSNLGFYEKANPLLERARQLALAHLPVQDPRRLDARAEWAKLLGRISKSAEGVTEIDAAFGERGTLSAAAEIPYANALLIKAALLKHQEKSREQTQAIRQAVAILKKTSRRELLEDAELQLGKSLSSDGEHAEAETILRRAYKNRLTRYGELHAKVAAAASDLAYALIQQDRFSEAELLQKKAVAINEKVYPKPNLQLLSSYFQLGLNYYLQKKLAEAVLYFEKIEKIQKTNPSNLDQDGGYLITDNTCYLLDALNQLDRFDESSAYVEKCRLMIEKHYGAISNMMGGFLRGRAVFHERQNRMEQARESLLKSAEVLKAVPAEKRDEVEIAFSLYGLAVVESGLKHPSALKHIDEALSTLQKYYQPWHKYVIGAKLQKVNIEATTEAKLETLIDASAAIGSPQLLNQIRAVYWETLAETQIARKQYAWAAKDYQHARNALLATQDSFHLTNIKEIDRKIAALGARGSR